MTEWIELHAAMLRVTVDRLTIVAVDTTTRTYTVMHLTGAREDRRLDEGHRLEVIV